MTHVGPAPLGSSGTATAGASFVEWGAVLAGAFLAAGISFVLLTFGAAIGLSATSPWPNSGASPTAPARKAAQSTPGAGPPASAPASPATPRARAAMGDDTRGEMSRILASSVANRSLTADNRAYLVQLVSQRAGISQQEAERRVDQA